MHVCLISPETFGYGLYGGIGAIAHDIAKGLAARSVSVTLLVPRAHKQPVLEFRDGYYVQTFEGDTYAPKSELKNTTEILRKINADIYHSVEATPLTDIARLAMPDKLHVVTLQAPATEQDWEKLLAEKGVTSALRRRFFKRFMADIIPGVRHADTVACQSFDAIKKCRHLYELDADPIWLPNPTPETGVSILKSSTPLVCFLGRWDPVKRPERYLELSKSFPKVNFVAMGKANKEFSSRELELKELFRNQHNLDMVGLKLGKEKQEILSRCWILVNTSTTECLPVSFLEAASHECAILSYIDADRFASRFGYHARYDTLAALETGLNWLLGSNRWNRLGKLASACVKREYAANRVFEQHLQIYNNLQLGK